MVHRGAKTPYRKSVAKPGILLLSILRLVCEPDTAEGHGKFPVRCSKRMSMDRNILSCHNSPQTRGHQEETRPSNMLRYPFLDLYHMTGTKCAGYRGKLLLSLSVLVITTANLRPVSFEFVVHGPVKQYIKLVARKSTLLGQLSLSINNPIITFPITRPWNQTISAYVQKISNRVWIA